jgi:hypothetical protein
MTTFKLCFTHNVKYVKGNSALDYCLGKKNKKYCRKKNCVDCLFEVNNSDIFKDWVEYNEERNNWKPSEYDMGVGLLIMDDNCRLITRVAFKTEELKQDAVKQIKKFFKTLPKQ